MAQETSIGNLGGGGNMNQEDARLVDSILNDLNSGGGEGQVPPQMQQQQMQQQQMQQQQMQQQQMQQQQMQQQQMPPEQHRAMLEQRQQQMMQHHMMQQQQQQLLQQQQLKNKDSSLLDKLQGQWKSILLIVVLSVFMNTTFIDSIFKINENTVFILEDGTLNMQAIIMKGLVIGCLFFTFSNLIN